MPGLRLLLRIAPFVVGALAVGVWLRRRSAARKALPPGVRVRELEAGPAAAAPVGVASEAAPRGANDALNGERTGLEPAAPGAGEPPRRFQREPIDIVTVVDDLLQAGR